MNRIALNSRRIAWRICAASVAIVLFCGNSVRADEIKRVLHLHSYHPGYSWSDSLAEGINHVLQDQAEVCVEYLDGKRGDFESYEPYLVDIIRVKYANTPLDVVLCSDDAALNFAQKYRTDLFAGIPVVCCGINYMTPEILAECSDATGVAEGGDSVDTAELALSLFPEAKKMIFVSNTDFPDRIRLQIKRIQQTFAGQVEFIQLAQGETMTAEKMLKKLTAIREPSVVILFGFSPGNGSSPRNRDLYDQKVMQTLTKSPHPIFSFDTRYVRFGAIGGLVQDGYRQGKVAGRMVQELLDGVAIEAIPPVYDSYERYLFNYQTLRRFNVRTWQLPEGSELIDAPDLLTMRYRKYMLIGGCFILLQMILIACLLHASRVRKLTEFALIRALDQAKAASVAKSNFIMVISHEIRTPMNAIVGLSDLLEDEQDRAVRAEYIELIQQSSTSLLRLIDEILEFANLNESINVAETAPCNLIERIGEVMRGYEAAAKRKGLKLAVSYLCDPEIRPILAWKPLETAISKLIKNALHYSEQGEIRMLVEIANHTEQNQALRISVADKGMGIAEEDMQRIFEAFQQADYSVTRSHQGLGLGLAICQRLVFSMGGTLTCKSKLGEGSEFTITLPLVH